MQSAEVDGQPRGHWEFNKSLRTMLAAVWHATKTFLAFFIFVILDSYWSQMI